MLNNKGFSLIELSLVLIFIGLALPALIKIYSDNSQTSSHNNAAGQIKKVTAASLKYINKYYSDIYNLTSSGPITVNITGPGPSPTLPSVQGAGFISATFSNNNPFGQQHFLIVRRSNTDQLEGIVITSGTQNIETTSLIKISNIIGASGGFISDTAPYDPNIIQGTFNSWDSAISNWANPQVTPQIGSLAALVETNRDSVVKHFIHRNSFVNFPEANQMETSLDMGLFNLNDINQLTTKTLNNDNQATISNNLLTRDTLTVNNNLTSHNNISIDNVTHSSTNLTSPIFSDLDDSFYFLDPSTSSNIEGLDLSNNITVGRDATINQSMTRVGNTEINSDATAQNSISAKTISMRDNNGNMTCFEPLRIFSCEYVEVRHPTTSHCCDGHAHRPNAPFVTYAYNLIMDPTRTGCFPGGRKVMEGWTLRQVSNSQCM